MPGYEFTEYSDILLDHFENPRNVGDIPDADAVGRAENPACGDVMVLSLRIRDDRIAEARFRATGCTAAIASASMTTELLVGRTVREASELTDARVAEALGGLPPAKLHCSVLAESAIRSALSSVDPGGAG